MPFQVVKPEVVSKNGAHFTVGQIIDVDELPLGASSGAGLKRLVSLGLLRPLDDSLGVDTLPNDADGWKVRAERAEDLVAQLKAAGGSDPEADKKLEAANAEITRLQGVVEEVRTEAKTTADAHAMEMHNFSADPAKYVTQAQKERDDARRDFENASIKIGELEKANTSLKNEVTTLKKANTSLTKELDKLSKAAK